VPEGKEMISKVSMVGDRLFVSAVRNGLMQTRIFTLEGKETGEITFPGLGFQSSVHHRCPLLSGKGEKEEKGEDRD
jgi:prolyl oligopeptidase